MNNATGGNVIYKFIGDKSNLDKTIKGSEEGLSKLGKVGKGVMVGMTAAVVGTTAALVSLTKKSLEAYADFEQLQGGLVSMMKGNTASINKVMETSKRAYKDLQMSQNDYLRSFESSYAIIQNGIGNNKNAIDYTNKSLQLTADLFNTFGGSTEQYATAINWALKGTYSYIDNLNLGIKGTQEGFIEAANSSGVLGRNIKDVKELTNDEIIDVLEHYAKKVGAWGKSQQEASTTIMGSINMVKAAYNDFLSGQGSIDNLVESVVAAGGNISKAIVQLLPKVVKGIVDLIKGIIPYLPELIKQLLPVLIDGVIALVIGIIGVLPDILNMIAEILPSQMPIIVDAIMKIIPMLIQMMPLFIAAGGKIIGALIEGVLKSVPSMIRGVKNMAVSMIKAVSQIPSSFLGIGKSIVKGLWNGIVGLKDWVINKVKALGKSIVKGLKNALGIHSPSTEFAMIGRFSVLGYTEALDKMQGDIQKQVQETFGISPQLTGTMSNHFSPNVMVNNDINVSTDPLGQTVKKIKTFSGGAKNDYNYGMGV